jgi:hypothetical protein
MKHLMDKYEKAGNESWVPMTARKMADHIGCSHMTAARALAELVALKFVDGEIATFEDKGKSMSRYKLNMFPFQGEKPKHEYMLGSEWNALRFRSWKPIADPKLRVVVYAPESDIMTFVQEHSERPREVRLGRHRSEAHWHGSLREFGP